MLIKRLVLAVVVAFLVFLAVSIIALVLIFVGGLLGPVGGILVTIGGFLFKWAVGIGIAFGVLAFLSGRTSFGFWPWP